MMPTRPPSYPPTFQPRSNFAKTQPGRRPVSTSQLATPVVSWRPKVAVRPEAVKVIAILAIAHATFTLLWLVASVVMVLASGKPADPTLSVVKADGFLFTWSLGTSLISFALAILLLLAA